MRVAKWVNYGGGEVEVEITAEDIVQALTESSDTMHDVKRALANFYGFLKAIPDEMIADLGPLTRSILHKALSEQVKRFEVTGDSVSG
jgi:hypothetical protein